MSQRLPFRWMVGFTLLPAMVFQSSLTLGLLNGEQLVAMAVAGFVAVGLARNPSLTCRLLVIVLPFQLLITSTIYTLGVGGGLVRVAGLWKELAILALGVAVAADADRRREPLDALDRVGIGFVSLGTLYGLAPALFGGAAAASLSMDDRFVSWRGTVLPIGILLLARRIPMTREQVERLFRVVVRVGIVLGCIGVVELAMSDWWNDLLVDVIGVNRFRVEVLGTPFEVLGGINDIRFVGDVNGIDVVRSGGPMVHALNYSFWMLVAFAVCLERRMREHRELAATWILGILVAGLLVSQTRSSALGALLVAVIAVLPRAGHSGRARAGLAVWLTGAVVAGLVLMIGTGAFQRLIVGSTASNDAHLTGITSGIQLVLDDPMGAGLGLGALGVGLDRSLGQITAENQFLDIGVQLGVLGMVLYVAVLLLAIRGLRGATRSSEADPVTTAAAGMRLALQGLLVPALVLQPFVSLELSWVVFLLVGVALGTGPRPWTPSEPQAVPRLSTRWA